MPEIPLTPAEFKPAMPETEMGKLALDNNTSPPSVRLSQADLDAIPDDAKIWLELIVQYFYIRVEVNDTGAQGLLAAGAANSFSGKRQIVIKDESIVLQADAVNAALAKLFELKQGQFNLPFKVRTTRDNWRPPQQMQFLVPSAKPPINVLLRIARGSTEFTGVINGRDEMLHNLMASLVIKTFAGKLARSIKIARLPQSSAPVRIIDEPIAP